MTHSTRRKQTVSTILRWLTLILVGWLTYALTRALWTIVHLGVPLFDWQWYLSIIALLIGLLARLAWHLPRSKLSTGVFIGLLIWTLVGYNGFGQEKQFYPAHTPPIRISFWAPWEISAAPEMALQDLRSAGSSLYLSIGGQQLLEENVQSLIDGLRRLAKHGIKVYLAVRASDYLSVPVHDEWIANTQLAAAVVHREGLTNVRGIIGDVEQPKHVSLDIWGTDRAAFSQAMRDLEGLIQWTRHEYPDLKLGVTAFLLLYLDSVDADSDLSIIHRSSVDPPGNWDFVNAMTYSSYFPSSWRAYYVYLVERVMTRLYPDLQVSHLIGLAVKGNPGEPVLGFDDLVRDAQLSRAMGVSEVVVYKLNSQALKVFGDDFIRQLVAAVNDTQPDTAVRVPFSRPVSVLIFGTVAVDALLDVRNWKGLLLIGWMVTSGLIVNDRRRLR